MQQIIFLGQGFLFPFIRQGPCQRIHHQPAQFHFPRPVQGKLTFRRQIKSLSQTVSGDKLSGQHVIGHLGQGFQSRQLFDIPGFQQIVDFLTQLAPGHGDCAGTGQYRIIFRPNRQGNQPANHQQPTHIIKPPKKTCSHYSKTSLRQGQRRN